MKILFVVIFIFINFICNAISDDFFIKVKVNNSIITNHDIENEKKYLKIFNPKLKELEKMKLYNLAKSSLIKERIKKDEVIKFFDDIDNDLKLEKLVLKQMLSKYKIQSKNDLILKLKLENLDYDEFILKLKTDTLWNQIVFNRFKNSLNINKEYLKKDLEKKLNNKKKKFEYLLSEILIENKGSKDTKKTIKEIKNNIQNFGFQNTANIYSISSTAIYGGEIGWVKETQLSTKILKELKNLNLNEVSKPIDLGNNFLLLKINEKKEIKENINIDKLLEEYIEFEKNRQLNQYSLLYYKRIKQNSQIYEN